MQKSIDIVFDDRREVYFGINHIGEKKIIHHNLDVMHT